MATNKKFKWKVKGKFVTTGAGDNDAMSTECTHETVIRDLCAECGADLRSLGLESRPSEGSASVSMVHSVPELVISKQEAIKLARKDQQRLLQDRKLVLLVDLDQTLIHTTNDLVPPNLMGVYHFQQPVSARTKLWYHTKFRPHTKEFLETISSLYELHICTFGSRNYAHTIARYLDPDGKFFSHRILSRDEFSNDRIKSGNLHRDCVVLNQHDDVSKQQDIEADMGVCPICNPMVESLPIFETLCVPPSFWLSLFPCGDSMVCIIDDREDVWNFLPNLVHVKPYLFFQGTADINAPPGFSKVDVKQTVVRHRIRRVSKSKDGSIISSVGLDRLDGGGEGDLNADGSNGVGRDSKNNEIINLKDSLKDDGVVHEGADSDSKNGGSLNDDGMDSSKVGGVEFEINGGERGAVGIEHRESTGFVVSGNNDIGTGVQNGVAENSEIGTQDAAIGESSVDGKISGIGVQDGGIVMDSGVENESGQNITGQNIADSVDSQANIVQTNGENTVKNTVLENKPNYEMSEEIIEISDENEDSISKDRDNGLQSVNNDIKSNNQDDKSAITNDNADFVGVDARDTNKMSSNSDDINTAAVKKVEISDGNLESKSIDQLKNNDNNMVQNTTVVNRDQTNVSEVRNLLDVDTEITEQNIDVKMSPTDEKLDSKNDDLIISDDDDDLVGNDIAKVENTLVENSIVENALVENTLVEMVSNICDQMTPTTCDQMNPPVCETKQNDENGAKSQDETLSESYNTDSDIKNISDDQVDAKIDQIDGKNIDGRYEEIEWVDEDDYLYYLEDILKKVHVTFYDFLDKGKSDDLPNLKNIIPYIKGKVLKGVNVLFSGVVPTNMTLEKSKVFTVAKALGAEIHTKLVTKKDVYDKTKCTTHVIAARLGTIKVNQAKNNRKMHVVTPDWLWACNERWEKVDERLYLLTEHNQIPVPEKKDLKNGKRKNYDDVSQDESDNAETKDTEKTETYQDYKKRKLAEKPVEKKVESYQEYKSRKLAERAVNPENQTFSENTGHSVDANSDRFVYDRVTGKRVKVNRQPNHNEILNDVAMELAASKNAESDIADKAMKTSKKSDSTKSKKKDKSDKHDKSRKHDLVKKDPTFADTINPLLMFTENAISDMDKEVDEMLDEFSNESSSEDEKHEKISKEIRKQVLRGVDESSSDDSLDGGAYPRGWGISKRVKSRSCSSESLNNDAADDQELSDKSDGEAPPMEIEESESERFVRNAASSSESENDYRESIGSVDDEIADAVQREFLYSLITE